MKYKINKFSFALAATLLVAGCADLDVENKNDPSVEQVLSTPDDYKSLVAGSLQSVSNLFTNYRGNTNLEFTADYNTMTNNVQNWWSEFKIEPRPAFNNTLANANRPAVVDNQWAFMNSAISSASQVIKAIELDGLEIGENGSENNMVLAAAYFAKGMAGGYLGITFDKGYLVELETDLATVGLSSYEGIVDQAVADLEKSAALSANSFTLPTSFLPTTSAYTNVELKKLANTYAAHFLLSKSRTKAQNDANDWAKILTLASNGITEDYVRADDGNTNYHLSVYISGLDWYFRVDHRIIRIMDPAYPKRFPLGAAATLPQAVSNDQRLNLYFKYEPSTARFNLTRGPQLRSHYRIKRWDNYYLAGAVGNLPYYFKYINDLVIAEAKVMANNDIAGAVDILNAGNRVTVGGLAPLDAGSLTKQQVLQIIWDERDLEVCRTDWAIPFMDARRRGILQKGVLLHFPVPATELLVLVQPLYTYGGQTSADGINTADGAGAWYTPGE